MSNVAVFSNEEFGEIRTVIIDGEPWFVGKDVACALGYESPRSVISKKVDNDDKGVSEMETPSGKQLMTIINESGLYSLIISSKIPSAKRFKRWVTSEVLPTIRKTGGYINNVDLVISTYFSDLQEDQKGIIRGLMTNITALQSKNKALNHENDLLMQKNLEWADRPLINSLIRAYASSIGNNFGKAWNDFEKELLYKCGINLNLRITNYLNSSGKKAKPKTLEMIDDSELASAISIAISMCRENSVNIDNLINNKSTE